MSQAIFQESQFETNLIPYPLQYAVLLPPNYQANQQSLPLLYFLHGKAEDHTFLKQWQPLIELAWQKGTLPPAIVVTPNVQQSYYLDYKDGSERWESLLTDAFLTFLKQTYLLDSTIMLFGFLQGGVGALRMGFKYPHRFAGIVALTPTIIPSFVWQQQAQAYQTSFGQKVYGSPFDQDYWLDNNPSAILIQNEFNIRDAKLAIYLECTDNDALELYRGLEFLHRILWERKIAHDYRLMSSIAYNGSTMDQRVTNGLAFVGRVLNGSSA